MQHVRRIRASKQPTSRPRVADDGEATVDGDACGTRAS
jgi:hypothetical protein